MRKQIVSVSPIQTAKLFGALYFLMSLPVVAVTSLLFLFSPYPSPGIAFIVLFQVLYLAFGFVATATVARLYNIAAKWVGGIEYTSICLDDAPPPDCQAAPAAHTTPDPAPPRLPETQHQY